MAERTAKEEARDRMLERIRCGLGAHPADAERRALVEQRLRSGQRHLIPERVARTPEQLAKLFRGFLEGQSATVIDVPAKRGVPAVIADFLRRANLPLRVRMGEDAYLGALDWSQAPALERQQGRAQATDEVGLSHAVAAAAETGTLILASGAANPVTLSFLPETQIIVVRARDIVGPYETAFDRLREIHGRGVMPRTVNFISGPSRTADIGGQLVTGAHGPRRLCVIIVGEDE